MSSTATRRVLSESVVNAVAAAEDVDPVDLEPPLYEVVDPDALDALFRPGEGSSRTTGRLIFKYCGHTVVVAANGTVTLTDGDGRAVFEENSQIAE